MNEEDRQRLLDSIEKDIKTLGLRFERLKSYKAKQAINKLLEVLIKEKHYIGRGQDVWQENG